MTKPNYSMRFGVGELARLFKVDRETVKTWSYHFNDYLSKGAQPEKGAPRSYTIDDVRVLAYVMMYWEDSPDLDYIRYGLNSGNQFEAPYEELIKQLTPVITHPPDDIEGPLPSVVIYNGLSAYADRAYLAASYKLAGDTLVEKAMRDEMERELICPILFNYRHAIELYLKDATNTNLQSHDLNILSQKFKALLQTEYNTLPPLWFEEIIQTFIDFDAYGDAFRYGGYHMNSEVFINLRHLKTKMNWFVNPFQKINADRFGMRQTAYQ